MDQQSTSRPVSDVGRRLETALRYQSARHLTLGFSQLALSILYVTACWLAHATVTTPDVGNFQQWRIQGGSKGGRHASPNVTLKIKNCQNFVNRPYTLPYTVNLPHEGL